MPVAFVDIILVTAEVGFLALLYATARFSLGRGLARAKGGGGSRARAAEAGAAAANLVLVIIFAALAIGVLAGNAYLATFGPGVSSTSFKTAESLSGELPRFGTAAALAIGVIVGTAVLLRLVRWGLRSLRQRALGWEQLRLNDDSVAGFFDLLSTSARWCAWLCAASIVAGLAGLPPDAQELLWLATRVAVVCSVALGIIRAVAAILDSLDALVVRYSAASSSILGWYTHAKPLVPLFRRCLELAIWLTAASILMPQISPFAPLAEYAPRLIGVVGVFFLARAAAELVNIMVDRQGAPSTLSAVELQQRATLLPLVKSIGRTLVYFCAFAVALNLLGINPIPLLAGAGILGVVIGFGAQAVINDLASGFFILSENQFVCGGDKTIHWNAGFVLSEAE
jgi:small-conductance mechanosensitive channel